ncbi:MAG: sugar kinase [Rhodobacteraceae bacterium]|nr:sugar kinase [Paracoccaceae bacterium]
MAPPCTIGCLGEVMLELVLKEPPAAMLGVAGLGVAGDSYNTAVYLARAAPAHQVDYITVLGRDGFSDRIRAHMRRYGVGSGRLMVHPNRIPGLYAIETDSSGERHFTYWRGVSAARCLGNAELPALDGLLDGLTHLFYSGISLAILPQENRARLFAAIAGFRARGGLVAFDGNYRPYLWENLQTAREVTAQAWQSCDIALPSLADETALFGDSGTRAVLDRIAGYGLTDGALKRGARGPIALDGTAPDLPQASIRVVDTTAAGDSFNAAFLAARIQGQSAMAAMRAGHALACEVIQHRGAIIF